MKQLPSIHEVLDSTLSPGGEGRGWVEQRETYLITWDLRIIGHLGATWPESSHCSVPSNGRAVVSSPVNERVKMVHASPLPSEVAGQRLWLDRETSLTWSSELLL